MRIKGNKTVENLIHGVYHGVYQIDELPSGVRGKVKSGVETLKAAASLEAEKAKKAAKKKKPKKQSK